MLKGLKGYTILQNSDIELQLSNGAFRCYVLIKQYCYADKDTCYPSQKTLAEILKRSVRTIQRYLKEIKEAGLLKIKRRGSISNMYTLISKKVERSVDKIVTKLKKETNVNVPKHKKELRFNNFTQRKRSEEEWKNLENKLLGWN